jgi:filamentous hemagglutinin family protein
MVAPSGLAVAAPQGGRIVGGQGAITNPSARHTRIEQESRRLAIDWQSFDIAADERVQFVQPGANATALNRIQNGNASLILGRLDANGRVILQNTSGILFGPGAMVDVGGLVATSLNVDLDAFMRGDKTLLLVDDPEAFGAIVNQGVINAASGGSVALVGDVVNNSGVVTARLGRVDLAAGSEAVLTFDADNLIGVRVTKETLAQAGVDAAVLNSGSIEGGIVVLQAAAARDLFDTVVNNTGIVRATGAAEQGGRIFLTGAPGSGDVVDSGVLDASGAAGGGEIRIEAGRSALVTGDGAVRADSAAGVGGHIAITGENVGLFGQAAVSADGATGGGNIRLGGGLRGGDADLANARFTYVGENATVSADATQAGDGGTVIAWADDSTRVHGTLSATGGAQSGDGGFIETSGKQYLEVTRTADVTATNGAGGTWLLDPRDLAVVAGTGITQVSQAGSVFTSTGASSQLGVDLLKTALTGGASVILQTDAGGGGEGDITWGQGVVLDYDGTGSNTLTLNAIDDILFSGEIRDVTAGGDLLGVMFNAGDDILMRGQVLTQGGNIEMHAGNADNANGVGGSLMSGFILEDGYATPGIYSVLDAGSGNLLVNVLGGGQIDIGLAGETYDNIAPLAGHDVTLNAALVRAADGLSSNREVMASGFVTINAGSVHGNVPGDSFDISARPAGDFLGLQVNDTGVGDIRLRAMYENGIGGIGIQQNQLSSGLVDIGLLRGFGAPSGDGGVQLTSTALGHEIGNVQLNNGGTGLFIEGNAGTITRAGGTTFAVAGNAGIKTTASGADLLLDNGSFFHVNGLLEVGTLDGNAVVFNSGGPLSFADATNVGGNLGVTSGNGSVFLNNMSVGGNVSVTTTSVGDGVDSDLGFLYGGVLDIDTAGGSISVTAKDIGTLDTVGGDGGAITVYSRASDSLTIVNAVAQGGPIDLYADQDLTVSGGINSLNGSAFGANVLVSAGGNVALGGVLAGQGAIDVYAGGNGLGSYNNFGQLNTVGGSINVNGGSGTDVFAFGPDVAFGNTVNVYGNGGAGDQVVVDGSGAAAHGYALNGNWLDIDGNTAIQNSGSLVELLITGSDFGDSLTVSGSWAALGWSAVNFEAGGGNNDTVTGPADPTVWQIGSSYGGYLGDGFVQVNFSGVETLVGGSANNAYSLLDGGYVDSIDGSAGFDTLDTSSQTTGDLQVDLQAGTATTLAGTIAVNGFQHGLPPVRHQHRRR